MEEHPVPDSEKMELRDNHRLGAGERDASADYPESYSETSLVRVRTGETGAVTGTGNRGRGAASSKQPGEVFGLRSHGARLRHADTAKVRVCAVVGDAN